MDFMGCVVTDNSGDHWVAQRSLYSITQAIFICDVARHSAHIASLIFHTAQSNRETVCAKYLIVCGVICFTVDLAAVSLRIATNCADVFSAIAVTTIAVPHPNHFPVQAPSSQIHLPLASPFPHRLPHTLSLLLLPPQRTSLQSLHPTPDTYSDARCAATG